MKMGNENVKIKCTADNYHIKYIQLKTYNLLSKSQYKVLAEIAKREFIGTEDRKVIKKKLGMSTQSLNNELGSLKKLGLVSHDMAGKTYRSKIEVPAEPGEITFKFEKS